MTVLELSRGHDSDGDPWFSLDAVADATGGSTSRRSITRAIHDPAAPRRLGRWLARRAAVPFRDLATARDPAEDRARAVAELAKLGALGRLAARLLGRAEDS